MVRIRPLMKGDQEAYVKAHNEGYSTEAWYGSLETALKLEDFLKLSYDSTFLAEVSGVIVGLIDIKIRDKIGDIENLVVLPKHRGRGIGKALLETAIEFLKDKVKTIRVETPIQSKNAIKFYGKNGFKHITNAYLIESQNKSKLEPYLGHNFYFVEDSRYWIPDNRQMELLKKLEANFSVIGKFSVMTKTMRAQKQKPGRRCNLLSTARTTSTTNSSSPSSYVPVRTTSEVTVWTIGHSNRSVKYFTDLLREHTIKTLVDVRSFPTSKVEHFKREQMEKWLPEHGISYVWLGKELGGYRRSGYQAHMKTKLFGEGIEKLMEIAIQKKVCIMCLESNPKYCHRRYISAHLERQGANVIHIRKKGQTGLLRF